MREIACVDSLGDTVIEELEVVLEQLAVVAQEMDWKLEYDEQSKCQTMLLVNELAEVHGCNRHRHH